MQVLRHCSNVGVAVQMCVTRELESKAGMKEERIFVRFIPRVWFTSVLMSLSESSP